MIARDNDLNDLRPCPRRETIATRASVRSCIEVDARVDLENTNVASFISPLDTVINSTVISGKVFGERIERPQGITE